MKALVTGGTGFVGSHLIDVLLREGHVVTALVRSPEKAKAAQQRGASPVPGDLRTEVGLEQAVAGQDVVFHVAGLVNARNEAEFQQVNRDGTAALVRAAERVGCSRFVLVSSLAAGGPVGAGTRQESTAERPVSAYGRSKLAAEKVVSGSALAWSIVRPPLVYGPRDQEVFRAFKLAAKGWGPVFGDGSQEISAAFAPDLAEALASVAQKSETVGKTYCACHPEIVTTREFVGIMGETFGRPVRVVSVPQGPARVILTLTGAVAALLGHATMLNRDKANEFFQPAWTGDPASLSADTGWKAAHDLRRGVRRTVGWYQEAHWL